MKTGGIYGNRKQDRKGAKGNESDPGTAGRADAGDAAHRKSTNPVDPLRRIKHPPAIFFSHCRLNFMPMAERAFCVSSRNAGANDHPELFFQKLHHDRLANWQYYRTGLHHQNHTAGQRKCRLYSAVGIAESRSQVPQESLAPAPPAADTA